MMRGRERILARTPIMSIGWLKKRYQDWAWVSQRFGFGWKYIGRLHDRTVEVVACSRLSGYTDDAAFVVPMEDTEQEPLSIYTRTSGSWKDCS